MSLRRYLFKICANAAQDAALHRIRHMACDLWNASLQRREDVYRRERRTLSWAEQSRELTALRAELPEWGAMYRRIQESTVKKIDLAFAAFFRRVRDGADEPGYPQFKSKKLYPGFGLYDHGRAWRFEPGPGTSRMSIKDVPGRLKLRGRFPAKPEALKTCDILWRDGCWWASIVVRTPARRSAGPSTGEVRFNLVDHFAAVRAASGRCAAGPEHAIYVVDQGRISLHRQSVLHKPMQDPRKCGVNAGMTTQGSSSASMQDPRKCGVNAGRLASTSPAAIMQDPRKCGVNAGMHSGHWRRSRKCGVNAGNVTVGVTVMQESKEPGGKARRGCTPPSRSKDAKAKNKTPRVGSIKWRRRKKRESRIRRRYHYALHVWSTEVAARFTSLSIVVQPVKDDTASGRGTRRNPGAQVKTKAAFNRHILDQCPAKAAQMLSYKVTEGGGTAEIIETQDSERPTALGNNIVEATKANRRVKKHARRLGKSDRPISRNLRGAAGPRDRRKGSKRAQQNQ